MTQAERDYLDALEACGDPDAVDNGVVAELLDAITELEALAREVSDDR